MLRKRAKVISETRARKRKRVRKKRDEEKKVTIKVPKDER